MDWIVLTKLLIILISYLPQGDSGPGLIDVENGQSFQYFGCYYDSKNIKSFSIGDFTQVPDPIGSCAKAVQADGHRMFFLKNGGHCLSVQGKVEQFFQVKKSSRCVNGLGGNGLMDVYVFSNVTVSCPVGIRRFLNPYCLRLMKKEINDSKRAYQLVPTFLNLFPGLNATSGQLVKIYQKEPINARWMGIYTAITPRNYLIATKFLNKTNGKEFETVDDYKAVLKFMIESQYSVIPKEQHKYFQLYFMQPDKPFGRLTRLCNWREDRIFTDQRFAGINPMSIQRISGSKAKAGVQWSSLQTKLSDTFNWEAATVDALGMQTTLAEAINRGHVFVLHYPVLDGIPSRNETPSTVKNRKLMSAVSPIAVFVSKPSRDKNQSNKIIPVAIQMGHTKDSPVFTPKDGDQWLLAKQTVQVADFVYAGSVEHLLKTHLLIEPICVAVRRHFHKLHPLRQILQFHCRGVLGTNRFFIKTLTGIHGTSDRLFGVGYNGGYAIMKRAFKDLTWDDTDFPANIKKRGLDDKSKVPYFPYRDDGELIHTSIKNMLNEYVKLYYKHTCHVRFDPELQNFANEVSFEGKFKPDGGHGMYTELKYGNQYE
ncbi:seed linoleate 9S-lipoxygenase [Exaiptasia diaphana]|uniref:Lipoxygenase domain-containing protein n=1 Tax=Exaiptasia diaphana TaxID=2652724 RepID=A0A913XH02_EXADI|nr:seed linoleate 9S-lipoxygenase [Exaiptasia diaphana]